MDPARTADIVELEQVLARYAIGMTRDDVEAVMEVFTPDGTYSAFGSTYALGDFPSLVAAAPKGLFLTGTPVLDLDGEHGTGTGYQTRSMTFLRRSGARDSGKPHDPARPLPSEHTTGESDRGAR
jgi:hypothetical protein